MSEYENLYYMWTGRIVEKLKKEGYHGGDGFKELINHLRHHVSELDTELEGKPNKEWLTSLHTMIDIIAKYLEIDISCKDKVERLYLHWLKDPQHSEAPPVEILILKPEKEYDVDVISGTMCRDVS